MVCHHKWYILMVYYHERNIIVVYYHEWNKIVIYYHEWYIKMFCYVGYNSLHKKPLLYTIHGNNGNNCYIHVIFVYRSSFAGIRML